MALSQPKMVGLGFSPARESCSSMLTASTGFFERREIQILFEELSYNEYDQQFRILCVEGLFEGGNEVFLYHTIIFSFS